MSVLRSILTRFRRDRGGAVAMFFALGAVGIMGAAGLAIDFSRGAQSKANLFAAADAAALAGARTHGTAAQREDVARRTFEANVKAMQGVQNVKMTPTNIVKEGKNWGYRVAVSGDVPTTLGRILGVQEVGVSAIAEAIGVLTTPTEVAMVLDTTFSMTGWKIATLKDAAVKLVDELAPLATGADKIRFGIVPFGQYVNVGMSNRNRPWMDVPSDKTQTHTHCSMQKPIIDWINCKQVWVPPQPPSPPGTCYNDGVPYSCGGGGGHNGYYANQCDPVYGPEQNVCNTWTTTTKWNGCAGSRAYPLNTRDENYVNRIPGIMDVTCGTEMLDLTTSTTQVKSRINALTPNGETYIPSGLIWGWRMLSPQAPLEAKKKTKSEDVRKFLILMTDGLNTKSPNYPDHEGSDGALANQLLQETCANISADKDNMITIFSVAFDVTDTATKNMLRNCAINTSGQFFDAKNSADFLAAFSKIGTIIAELRLTK